MGRRDDHGNKLDSRTRARLKALSRIRQRSQHWLMKEAIERYLDREESAADQTRDPLEGLDELTIAGNSAAHGATVRASVAQWAIEYAPKVLAVLDDQLESAEG